ncbi:dihydropteroate synthase [Litchfieldia alkalitelluris]|uniref:dihydropteroate synthase n=1 Tax=Litchfieldia alkalitelluris TaxID=304268 RepID=UPI0009978485|nr:dihydropteroate synthase [Litchfieldia alkalitelluris]
MINLKYPQLECGPFQLTYAEKTFIMGILNMTPDSFSDGGKFNHLDLALEHAREMVAEGADLIDIGGESTRPGSEKVSQEDELKRVVPVIKTITSSINVPISIDTYKAEVARQAIEAGAHIINDVWGAKADPKMAQVAADYNVPIILMHNRSNKNYKHLINDMIDDLNESINIVKSAGVKDDKIILDPGIGFAKDFQDNLEVLRNLEQFNHLGYPVLLGTSRKTFIGHVLDLPPAQRDEGTGATTALGIQKGCSFVRVHNVRLNKRIAQMMDVLEGKGGEND